MKIYLYKIKMIYIYGLNSGFNGLILPIKEGVMFMVKLVWMARLLQLIKDVVEEVEKIFVVIFLRLLDSINKKYSSFLWY